MAVAEGHKRVAITIPENLEAAFKEKHADDWRAVKMGVHFNLLMERYLASDECVNGWDAERELDDLRFKRTGERRQYWR